jgi:ketosteroid isomerase-like protein
MRSIAVTLVLHTLFIAPSARAQSPEAEVMKAQEALSAAAAAGDREALAKMFADELRWVTTEGSVRNKAQQIARVTSRTKRTLTEWEVPVFADMAVATGRSAAAGESQSERFLRVYVKRGAQWLLLSHVAVTITG